MANDSVKVYTADEVIASFGPIIFEEGLGSDEFIRIEQETDDTEDEVGVDGEVTVSRTNDRRATMTVILKQTSRHNAELSVLSNLARNAPGMAGGVHPFLVKEPNGTAIHTAQNCWVRRGPDITYARKAAEREWQVRIASLVRSD